MISTLAFGTGTGVGEIGKLPKSINRSKIRQYFETNSMLDLVPANLPKNVNGFRTTHTCELCGFEPKTKNKYREKQDHLVMKHFKEKIDKIFPHCRPYSCPSAECSFTGKDKQALLRHYTGKHGILEKYLREALAEKGKKDSIFGHD